MIIYIIVYMFIFCSIPQDLKKLTYILAIQKDIINSPRNLIKGKMWLRKKIPLGHRHAKIYGVSMLRVLRVFDLEFGSNFLVAKSKIMELFIWKNCCWIIHHQNEDVSNLYFFLKFHWQKLPLISSYSSWAIFYSLIA